MDAPKATLNVVDAFSSRLSPPPATESFKIAFTSPPGLASASVQLSHAPAAGAVAVHCGRGSFRRGCGCVH